MYQHHNRQGADIVLEAPKHDPLIKWPTWDHVTVWKIYISIFMRFIANKLGRLVTLGRIFITQMLKSSPTSCLLVSFQIGQQLFCFMKTHQHSSDQIKILKDQSAQVTIRAVSIAYCLWLHFPINRVLNLTNCSIVHDI